MLRRLCCCCCFSSENSIDERQPLLRPTPSLADGAESVRQTRQAHSDAQNAMRIGRLVMRRVCVTELDQRFSDMAASFNEQQERYESMGRHIRNLRHSCGCADDDQMSISECVGKIREEHGHKYKVLLKMKGYDFFLCAITVGSQEESEEQPLPRGLQLAQEAIKCISDCAKATISKGTTLQELIGWLLRSKDLIAEQVKGAAATYQEQGRLNENLKENVREVRRAKDLSLKYRQQAGEILTEAAKIAGVYL